MLLTFSWLYFSSGKVKNHLSVIPKVYKYTLILDKKLKPLLNKTNVSTCFYYYLQILTFIFVF